MVYGTSNGPQSDIGNSNRTRAQDQFLKLIDLQQARGSPVAPYEVRGVLESVGARCEEPSSRV